MVSWSSALCCLSLLLCTSDSFSGVHAAPIAADKYTSSSPPPPPPPRPKPRPPPPPLPSPTPPHHPSPSPRHPPFPVPWGLDRIDQTDLPLDGAPFLPSGRGGVLNYVDDTMNAADKHDGRANHSYAAAFAAAAGDAAGDDDPRCPGRGVHVFVLDTGLDATHSEFTGRVGRGFDAQYLEPSRDGRTIIASSTSTTTTATTNPDDCQGHGTHVAGVAVGLTLVGSDASPSS